MKRIGGEDSGADSWLETPIGWLRLRGGEAGLRRIDFCETRGASHAGHPLLDAWAERLAGYFAGRYALFDLSLDLRGTTFQLRVWRALRAVPFAATATYGEIARSLGRPGAGRAVGQANHRNPLPIVVPCHRVVGADGALTGYGGGMWRKEWLLAHERRLAGMFDKTAKP